MKVQCPECHNDTKLADSEIDPKNRHRLLREIRECRGCRKFWAIESVKEFDNSEVKIYEVNPNWQPVNDRAWSG